MKKCKEYVGCWEREERVGDGGTGGTLGMRAIEVWGRLKSEETGGGRRANPST
jgi:hypothetical protein